MLWSRFREFMDRDSVVGVLTRYGLDGPEIGTRSGRDSPHPSRQALGPIQSTVSRVMVFMSGVKQPELGVDNSSPSSSELKVRVYLYTTSEFYILGWICNLSVTSSSCLIMQVRCHCWEIWIRPEIPKFDSLTWEEALPSCAVSHHYSPAFKVPPSVLYTKILRFPTFSPEDFSHVRCPLSLQELSCC